MNNLINSTNYLYLPCATPRICHSKYIIIFNFHNFLTGYIHKNLLKIGKKCEMLHTTTVFGRLFKKQVHISNSSMKKQSCMIVISDI